MSKRTLPLTLTKVLRCFAELGAVLKAAERKDAQARKAQAEEARLSPLCSVPRRNSIRASGSAMLDRIRRRLDGALLVLCSCVPYAIFRGMCTVLAHVPPAVYPVLSDFPTAYRTTTPSVLVSWKPERCEIAMPLCPGEGTRPPMKIEKVKD